MRYLLIKNKNLYKKVISLETKKIQYKSIIYNENVPNFIRQKAITRLDALSKGFSYVKIKQRCFFTNNSRSVFNFFKLSRIRLKWLIANNYMNAIKKGSW